MSERVRASKSRTPKCRTNVTLDADLLGEARTLGINLSATLEDRLHVVVAERRRELWLAENRTAIADANAFLARHGLWSDGQRQF
ncbi:MAG: type II toxin-antitoxin system CcdA family antitoxin [Steroidobacteraceae bacterium]